MALLIEALGEAADHFERDDVVTTRRELMEQISAVLRCMGINPGHNDWKTYGASESSIGLRREDIAGGRRFDISVKESMGLDRSRIPEGISDEDLLRNSSLREQCMVKQIRMVVDGERMAKKKMNRDLPLRLDVRDLWREFFSDNFPDSDYELVVETPGDWYKKVRKDKANACFQGGCKRRR